MIKNMTLLTKVYIFVVWVQIVAISRNVRKVIIFRRNQSICVESSQNSLIIANVMKESLVSKTEKLY